MICGDERAVLREYGIYCGIINKARRNRGLSKRQKRLNRVFARISSAVERPFGVLKRSYGW